MISDIDAVCKLYLAEENIQYSGSELSDYIDKSREVYQRMLNFGSYTLGCFTGDDILIGVININKILDYYPKYEKYPYIHLETFIVDKQWQGLGVGTFLMFNALELARQEGVTYIIIQSSNPRVHSICEKLGLIDSRRDMRIDFIKQ